MGKLSRKLFDFLDNLEHDFSVHRWRSTVKQNVRVGGAKKSRHLDGAAVDVSADTIEGCEAIAQAALFAGFQGVELDLDRLHVHIDEREIDWHVVKRNDTTSPLKAYLSNSRTV